MMNPGGKTKVLLWLLCRRSRAKVQTMKTTKAFKFTTLGNAQTFADGCLKMQGIILGDDQRFWVVGMADFDRLIKAGYEAA